MKGFFKNMQVALAKKLAVTKRNNIQRIRLYISTNLFHFPSFLYALRLSLSYSTKVKFVVLKLLSSPPVVACIGYALVAWPGRISAIQAGLTMISY